MAAAVSPPPAPVRERLSAPGASGADVRDACRSGALDGHTSGLAPGYAQANLVILPREHALAFLTFCVRNPKPCPLLEVTDAGVYEARAVAPGSDVRTDLPRYRVWRGGVCDEEVSDIRHLWPDSGGGAGASDAGGAARHPDARTDWVAFLLGCSFSFEEALLAAGLPVRHLQQERVGGAGSSSGGADPDAILSGGALAADPRNVPMYRTCVPTTPAGPFSGPLVVSMRPMTPAQAAAAAQVTAACPRVHGRCVYAGDPAGLGIADLGAPHYGDAVTLLPGEVPVFWACGVTPQAALLQARLPIAITHAPGHMFVCDARNADITGPAELAPIPGSLV
jgi:uncharacterized protein YcsI (UPF0317 family)